MEVVRYLTLKPTQYFYTMSTDECRSLFEGWQTLWTAQHICPEDNPRLQVGSPVQQFTLARSPNTGPYSSYSQTSRLNTVMMMSLGSEVNPGGKWEGILPFPLGFQFHLWVTSPYQFQRTPISTNTDSVFIAQGLLQHITVVNS